MVIAAIYNHAQADPDRTAIVFNNDKLSYRRFARRITNVRRYLMAQDIGGEGFAVLPIGDLLDAWIVGFALRSLGLTTVIVRSRAEIATLGLPKISCVVTADERPNVDLAVECAEAGWHYVNVPSAVRSTGTAHAAATVPDTPIQPGGHILLTSGTTGFYKKLLLDPAGESVFVDFLTDVLQFSRRTVVNLFNFGGWTGIGYRMAISAWSAGGCAVMSQDPKLRDALRHPGITDAHATPQLLEDLMALPASAFRRDDRIRLFVTGGHVSPALAQKVKARLTSRLHTYYSSTECSTTSVTLIEQAEDLRWHRIVPSRTVEIVDDRGRLLPAGQVGLVRIKPIAGLTGYLHDEKTSRVFFRDGYFFPGDLGVIGPDGRLGLHGRANDVINLRGNKLAAGPIEQALQEKLAVKAACVLSVLHDDGEEVIHVTIESSDPIAEPKIAAIFKTLMPGARGAKFHVVDALPRNHMGKIQRDVLKERLVGTPAVAPAGRG